MVSLDKVYDVLERVTDPEIRRLIVDLNMVDDVQTEDNGTIMVSILLTTAGCFLHDPISADVKSVIGKLEGVKCVFVKMDATSSGQRAELQAKLRGSVAGRVVPFAQKGNLMWILIATSGEGDVGKSSVTVNLTTAMAASGLKTGLMDTDILGPSVPRVIGVGQSPTALDGMITPPVAHDVEVISTEVFPPDNSPVLWRGPQLCHTLEQLFPDIFWGNLGVLLLDLLPGTGDVAISVTQLIPNPGTIVVTMPQVTAAGVAERVGRMTSQTNQCVVGVIENMSYLVIPGGSEDEILGHGGGATAAEQLAADLGYGVPLPSNVPIEVSLRGDGGKSVLIVLAEGSPEAQESLHEIAGSLARRVQGPTGLGLSVTPI